MKVLALFVSLSLLTFIMSPLVSAEQTGSISGQVFDSRGAAIPGATVSAMDASASEKSITTDRQGQFVIKGLTPGKYVVRASANSFALSENKNVEVKAGEARELRFILSVASIREIVQITSREINADPNSNASAVVFRGKDLDALPEDADELEAALRTLAGPAAGIDEIEFEIDGFSGGRVPPKTAIREVRINRNPFSAEYERVGFGGVEIFTKPGTEKFHGQAYLNFNDARLNSRSPFALNRAPSQSKVFGGSALGPIEKGKSSYFVSVSSAQIDQSQVINATTLDPSLNIVPLRQDIAIPTRSFSIMSRVNYQLNQTNTLVASYHFGRNSAENQGVSGLSLPSRAFQTSGTSQDLRLTETMIVNPKTVNETRFGYTVNQREQEGDNSIPTVNVSGAFIGGGSQIGLNFTDSKRLELQNYTTTMFGKHNAHALKFGARLRKIAINDRSEANFGGIFTFAGVRDQQTGAVLYSSIEQYRQKLLGNSDPRFNPNQFSIASGDPLTDISQSDLGVFVNDDWRVRQNLTLSFGLRYESQTNIHDHSNFAPRLGFAYALDGGNEKSAKTVIRGGFGIFYSRLNESLFLQARRFNGTRQTQYVVSSDPAILGQPLFTLGRVTNVPTIAQLTDFVRAGSSTVRRLDENLRSPITYQFALSVDRQLPLKTSVSASYIANRSLHMLDARNINAPVCPPLQECSSDAPRPDQAQGNIYLSESFGVFNQQQLLVSFNSNLMKGVSFGGNYRLGFSRSNSDGAGTFPAYSYDLGSEYGNSSQDVRHSLNFYGSFQLPWKIRMSPMMNISSGRPFNITSGIDSNRDSIFNDRPTFAQLFQVCNQRGLTNSFCNSSGVPNPGTTVIPRNFGRGPKFSMVNLNVSRTFAFKTGNDRAYNLTVAFQASNLLNHTNKGMPIGNLSSDRFGQPFTSADFGGSAANRRISMQVSFNF